MHVSQSHFNPCNTHTHMSANTNISHFNPIKCTYITLKPISLLYCPVTICCFGHVKANFDIKLSTVDKYSYGKQAYTAVLHGFTHSFHHNHGLTFKPLKSILIYIN